MTTPTATPPAGDASIHRLIDMVVEEVSLVDRAANLRRFLLVKRSELVPDSDDDDLDLPDDADAPALAAPGGGGAAAPTVPAAPAAGAVSTAAVVAALESLTGVVGLLAAQVTEKARPVPPKRPPAKEPDPPADDAEPDDPEDPEADDPADDAPVPPRRGTKPPPPRGQRKGDEPLAGMRAQLDRIEASLTGRAAKRAPAPPPDVATRLDDIAASIATLTTTLGGQAGRLAKVERTVGVPASRPVEARPAGDEAISWPLDINAPRDRASVAKDVSFHD
jgi:hypothetical protein